MERSLTLSYGRRFLWSNVLYPILEKNCYHATSRQGTTTTNGSNYPVLSQDQTIMAERERPDAENARRNDLDQAIPTAGTIPDPADRLRWHSFGRAE